MIRTSIGGITVGNSWMYNNPDLIYPEDYEQMSEEELEIALRADIIADDDEEVDT